MPRMGSDTLYTGPGNFGFTGTRIEHLGATEYTLVTIAIDVTGSTAGFSDELRQMLIAAIAACQKSPRSENLLARVVLFSSCVGVQELHGFMPLSDIDVSAYAPFRPDGMTPLCDAVYSAVGATATYGKDLYANDFTSNAIIFIITDGDDNASSTTPSMIAQEIEGVRLREELESILTVLIGINAAHFGRQLKSFQQGARLDQYIDAGDATPGKLAKLAAFVSQSVSSQSQALGTGGPSQNISATI